MDAPAGPSTARSVAASEGTVLLDDADLPDRPEAEDRLAVDVLLRDLAPVAAVVAAVPVVAQDVVVPLAHGEGLVGLVVVELRGHVGLLDGAAVHEEDAAAQLHGVAGKPDHA